MRVRMPEEEVERRRVREADQVGSGVLGHHGGRLAELPRVVRQPVLGQHHPAALAVLDLDVRDVGPHGHREVRRHGPGRRRPDQRVGTVQRRAGRGQGHAHGDGGILTHLVGVVEAGLLVRQRCLLVPAVRQHAEALVDQPLVVEFPERPHHRLHEVEIERLVVVVEVHPPRLTGDVVAPLAGVPQHRLLAVRVELRQTHRVDLALVGDAELLLRLELGGQTVAVPTESALDLLAAHRLEARHQVLDVAGQQVAVVRETVGERRAVVEDVLVGVGTRVDGRTEGAVGVPAREDLLLEVRELHAAVAGLVRHAGVAGAGLVGAHGGGTPVPASSRHGDELGRARRRSRGTTPLGRRAGDDPLSVEL